MWTTLIKFGVTLLSLGGWIRDWIKVRRAERLGRLEQQEAQRKTDDSVIQTGIAARRQAELDLARAGDRDLRADDGFRRDE